MSADAVLSADYALYRTLRRHQRRCVARASRLAGNGYSSLAAVAKDMADRFGADADRLLTRLASTGG